MPRWRMQPEAIHQRAAAAAPVARGPALRGASQPGGRPVAGDAQRARGIQSTGPRTRALEGLYGPSMALSATLRAFI